MFKVTLDLSPEQEELIGIAEHVREAYWKAATSSNNNICTGSRKQDALITTVDFNEVYPLTAYDATSLTLYWLVYNICGTDKELADEVKEYLSDGVTIQEALEIAAQKRSV
jgi:hypothetical protein